jgi:hypothetical protein
MVVLCEVLESWTSLTAVCINCEGARWACEELGCVFFVGKKLGCVSTFNSDHRAAARVAT